MIWLTLVTVALAGVIAWHARTSTFRDIRVSVARFMPQPPRSNAPRTKISLTKPLTSIRFWLRVAAIGLLLGALVLSGVRLPAVTEATVGLRVVLDVSASMGVGSRLEEAVAF